MIMLGLYYQFTTYNGNMKTFTLGDSKEQVEKLLPEKQIKVVQLGQMKVCVVRISDKFYAFETNCPHRMANLSQGWVNKQSEVICPLHEYRFDLSSGQVRSGDCGDLKVFKADITEKGLKISLP